jgi:hypothetical protein
MGVQMCVDGGNKSNGTGCNDGQMCTKMDICTNGVCGGTSYSCSPSLCQATSVCDGSGCTVTNKPNNTTCDDGNPCTVNTTCQGGVCTGTTYSCTPNQCQSSAACDGAGGCLFGNKPANTPCIDGNSCTFGDVCNSGTCGGTPYSCPFPGPGFRECESVDCNGTGGCTTTDINEGSVCHDCCTGSGATCQGGVCQGGSCCNSDFCCNL